MRNEPSKSLNPFFYHRRRRRRPRRRRWKCLRLQSILYCCINYTAKFNKILEYQVFKWHGIFSLKIEFPQAPPDEKERRKKKKNIFYI